MFSRINLSLWMLSCSWLCTFWAGADYLYVSNGTDILRHQRRGRGYESVYHQSGGKIVGLATDIDDGLLFWSDVGENRNDIFRSRLDGTDVTLVAPDVEECNGISVDWNSKHIYWTDAGKRTLEIANYDGTGRRILIGHGLIQPRGIVVDAVFGYVFWADLGAKRIERSWLDGSDRKVLVDTGLEWPNQLAISYSTRRLYWVDSKRQVIMSCDLDGGDITIERNLLEASLGNPVFGLVVIGNNAFISTWFTSNVYSTYVATREALWEEEFQVYHTTELYSLVTTARSTQKSSSHLCGFPHRSGCTHLCLPTRGSSYKCACPSYGGLALSFNAKSCEAPSELLFFTLKDSGEVGFISVRGAQSVYLTLAGRSTHPSAVTYDPIKQVVYWSDVEENVIYQSSLAGPGRKEVFLNGSDGIGVVDALAIDWISRQLYFTNMGQSSEGLDGSVYTWHRIEKISLQRTGRKTVISDVERPRGIALDLENGFMFYGDWGKQPTISQAMLDGSQSKVILNKGLSNPNGLTFYKGRLYAADANFNNKTSSPHLMLYDVEMKEWTQLKLSSNVSLPMGLAVQGDTLYYSDWVSTNSMSGYIKSYNLRFGVDNNVLLTGRRPTGLHYSPLARRKEDFTDDACTDSPCSDECIRMASRKERPFQCLCPDKSTKVLTSDNITCARPQNFLLVADLNTLKMVSLDDNTESRAHTLLYSDVHSNFVALAYDDVTDTVYWSDVSEQSIYSSPFLDFKPTLVYKSNHYIDGLVVDTDKQRLFWTGYDINGTGVIARLNIQRGSGSYSEIIQGLNNPRAIHLYPKKKLIFWTEYGSARGPTCVNKARISGKHPKMLISKGLFWPNSLATHDELLYVADGAGKVFVMDFNGENQEELYYLTGTAQRLFGLVVMDTVLFYSDIFTNSVVMVDRVTGEMNTLISHLSRPTSIVVYHPKNLTVSGQCATKGNMCAETCVPVPRGFHCHCPIGSKLASDGFNCIKMASPWEITDENRCSQCHPDAYCSQLIPTLSYQCVCKAGYEGDGSYCSECGQDFIKPLLGNHTCYPCPLDSTTRGSKTSSQCFCNNPNHVMVNNVCTDITTTTSTTTTTTTTISSGPTVEDSNEVLTTEQPVMTTYEETTQVPVLPEKPHFENCPHGQKLDIDLPDDSDHIWLPITWIAKDALGKELTTFTSAERKGNSIKIQWKSKLPHMVLVEARDRWGQTTPCQFQVQLDDVTAPYFTYCPKDIVKKTSLNSEPVDWKFPAFDDNVGNPQLRANYEPKSEFHHGNTTVIYTARDVSGNEATCSFRVEIIQEEPCLSGIKNGVAMCGFGNAANICHIACANGYTYNPLDLYPRSFSCKDEKDVANLQRLMAKSPPCFRKRRPSTAHQEFNVVLKGPCHQNDTELKAVLRTEIISVLENKTDICLGATCIHGPITLNCDSMTKKRRYVEDTIKMSWVVVIEYLPPEQDVYSSDVIQQSEVQKIVANMKNELRSLVERLNIVHNKFTYGHAIMTKHKEIIWFCRKGEMKLSKDCVPCLPGSYLNTTLQKCMLCNEGHFQNSSRQEQCWACPEGTTLETGAVSKTQCIVFTALFEMRKFLIIAAGVFGFVVLCLILGVFIQYHNRKKNTQDDKHNNPRYMTPNVYAQAPLPNQKSDYIRGSTIPRDYFMTGGHDYEDIDGQHRSVFDSFPHEAAGCRDSLSSFKAQTDMTFLQSPSPNGTKTFRTSDDGLITVNSPHPSAKSLTLYADDRSFQGYNGTMGSFKGSPPASPYRSLHLAGSSMGSGSGDSPTHTAQTLSSLMGDESPYTSRLIRDRLVDPESPYRIISQDRRSGTESPYKVKRKIEVENPHMTMQDPGMINFDGPYRLTSPRESPYRSPAFQRELNHSLRVNTDFQGHSPTFPQATDVQNSFRTIPESPPFHRQISIPQEDTNSFMPSAGDFLYKRPPSPLSPPISSKKSQDSLPRSPSTPRASPGMSRKRMDSSYRTPPMSQRRKLRNEMGIYEYES